MLLAKFLPVPFSTSPIGFLASLLEWSGLWTWAVDLGSGCFLQTLSLEYDEDEVCLATFIFFLGYICELENFLGPSSRLSNFFLSIEVEKSNPGNQYKYPFPKKQ